MTPTVRVVLGHGHIGYSVKIYSNYLATPFSATGHIFWSKEDFLSYAFSFYGHIGPILGPEPLTQGPWIHKLDRGSYNYDKHAFEFLAKQIILKIFQFVMQAWNLVRNIFGYYFIKKAR